MSPWLSHPLFLPSIIVGVTILLWATSPLPEFMTALLFLLWRWDGESSCAGGDAVMYRAGGDTPKRWLFVLLATERNLLIFNRASAEEIQDHQCDILNQQVIK